MRTFLLVALGGILLAPANGLLSSAGGAIIPETTAQRHGLTRPWITQIQLDRSRGRVRDVILYEGIIYVQTDRAMVHAVDAETGQSLWAKQIGQPEHPSLAPAASHDLLGTLNGSRLYVLNRYNGDVLWDVEVKGAPGAGVAMSRNRAYVPMVSGMVLAYRLDPLTDPIKELGKFSQAEPTKEEKARLEEDRRQNIRLNQEYVPPLACQSAGRILVPPLVTLEDRNEEYVAWATDKGFLNVGRIDRRDNKAFEMKYRVHTDGAISAPATYLPPDPKIVGDSGVIFSTSADGYVRANRERTGDEIWKFSTADPLIEPAAVIDERLFVATQSGGMFCLDAKTGKQLWWAPEILRFLAAAKQRVYVADKIGRTVVLDAKTGGRLDVMATQLLPVKMTNTQTDRIYLGTDTGLLQCLHEAEQTQPIHWGEARKAPQEEEPEKPKPGVKGKAGSEEGAAHGDLPAAAKPKTALPRATPRPATKPKHDDTDLEPVKPKKEKPVRTPKGKAKSKLDAEEGEGGLGAGGMENGNGDAGNEVSPKNKAGKKTKTGKGVKNKKAKGDDENGFGAEEAPNPFG